MAKNTPHIVLKEGTHIARTVLMPGDPLRAKYIAENFLENPVLFNDVRNMLGYTGMYQGKEVSVMGSGMGIPSFCIYAHELYNIFDADTIIRVGSAGGLMDHVKVRDIVIAMTASTNSSVISSYNFVGTPAPCADYGLLRIAVREAEAMGISPKVGNVYSSDFFYYPDPAINERAKAMGILCMEMECAGLYLEAMASGKRALGIFTISDHIFTGQSLPAQERQTSFREMMEIALRTAVSL